jgi:membrane protein
MGKFLKKLGAPVVRAWRGTKRLFTSSVSEPIVAFTNRRLGRGKITIGALYWQVSQYIIEHELWLRASAIAFGSIVAGISSFVLLLTLVRYFVDFTGVGAELLTYLAPDHLTTVLRPFLPDILLKWMVDLITFLVGRQPVEILSVSLFCTVWFASGLNVTIINCLNVIYGVKETRSWFYLRRLALRMTILQLFTLFAGVVAMLDTERFLRWVNMPLFPGSLALTLKWVIVCLVLMVSFACLFHIGPDSAQKKTWVTPGSIVGAVVFVICSVCFRLFVDRWGQYSVVYGGIAGIMVLLSWLWMASFVMLLAAELNRIIEFTRSCHDEGGSLAEDGSCGPAQDGVDAKAATKPPAPPVSQPTRPPPQEGDGK